MRKKMQRTKAEGEVVRVMRAMNLLPTSDFVHCIHRQRAFFVFGHHSGWSWGAQTERIQQICGGQSFGVNRLSKTRSAIYAKDKSIGLACKQKGLPVWSGVRLVNCAIIGPIPRRTANHLLAFSFTLTAKVEWHFLKVKSDVWSPTYHRRQGGRQKVHYLQNGLNSMN